MQGHTEQVNGVVHLPSGGHIITGSLDRSLRLWDLESGAQIGEEWWDENNAVWSMALSPNGKTIASGSGHGNDSVMSTLIMQHSREVSRIRCLTLTSTQPR
jgi:WD40 repeat protein